MRTRLKTIFSNPSARTTEEVEAKKTNWTEKLFNKIGAQSQISSTAQKIEQTPEEKGLEEAVKSHALKAEKNRQAVEDMVNNSNRVLLKISSVFPWDLFPSSIVVEETRLTITHRQLFASQVQSVDIKNISNIFIDNSILFSQLTIVSNTFAENQTIVNRLRKKEAVFVRRIIEGLRMFVDKDIDTTGYEKEELINKLRELSTTKMDA